VHRLPADRLEPRRAVDAHCAKACVERVKVAFQDADGGTATATFFACHTAQLTFKFTQGSNWREKSVG